MLANGFDYDVIVIGVGGMGSSATYHLAQRDQDVLGLERYDIPHTKGSSHGITRIVRKTSYENSAHLPLLERAYQLWHDLDARSATDLIHTNGYVAAGPEDGSLFTKALDACKTHNLDHDVLTATELSNRYPGYNLPTEFMTIVEPDGGFVHADQCVVAHGEKAHQHGAEIRAREEVLDWSTDAAGVEVTTSKESYTAKKLVVTAGAWASRLVPQLESVVTPERQVLSWFQPERREDYTPANFPVFSIECTEGHFYGTPIYQIPGFKLGKHHHFSETIDPDSVAGPTEDDENVLRNFAKKYLSTAAGPTMGLETCIYTNSPDGEFIIDTLPNEPRVIVAAGFSGHGFKFSSVIGEILADLAINNKTDHPIQPFSIERLAL